ncbi:hypothetical protein [Granulicatella sp. HMSC31F03]|uniref:hypothetical protein n=1 Tax=Granulicatella sp. HMSC31F03 TaxID=1581074 RepID=UPI0008A5B63B|nr:hypothetical protein [Granulicatella sp. HMSC31F03]OFT02041.1 hypothetical protein HMPREF3106_01500 [Granulicatella sp. HMSC31F03]
MKKKTAITVSTLLLLTVGSVTALNVINPSWRENTIFATTRDKKLAYLKAHEEEIVAWVRSKYPKIQSVQLDWNTMSTEKVSNGISTSGYILTVRGTFNDLPETVIWIDFLMSNPNDIPSMSKIVMNQPPSIKKGEGLYIFE